MKRTTLLICIATVLCSLKALAQWQPMSNLTIFSDDGAKFFLVLNGERYNDTPQTNIRVEELPNPYYDCKIIFEDKNIPTISKSALMLQDIDGVVMDVTYRIKKQGNGKYTLRFFSEVPVQQNMPRPSNVAVYHYGQPNTIVTGNVSNVYETVTVQQTTTGGGGTVGMNVNMGGVGMNVTIPVDDVDVTYTTTTTTTTTTGGGGVYNTPRPQPQNNGGYNGGNAGCRQPMSSMDFEEAKKAVSAIAFEDTKLSTAEQIISANCMNTTQIMAMIKLFSFEDSKVSFAKSAYDRCVDKNNYYKVGGAFTFDGSKTELNNFLQSRR